MDILLKSEVIGRLGCHHAGRTYVVPITYAYQSDYIYCHTKEGTKIEMMRQNPHVCFEVDHIQNMANWQSIIIQGLYEELEGVESENALHVLVNRIMPLTTSETSQPKFGLDKVHIIRNPQLKPVVFRLKILERTGRFEKS
ncbi:pyridoxamine 5'-phosphate oxidase family protein [Fulvivirgaceae bacterium BMA10]|uniref:Pyridoxamine 5'-phosphate oxidase family protein n=1 Tax=Splendidivirga corallicola TaxID=3051826 RepID=A0ABT8KWF1_9BACT|nr:pyridoxamine 5'-phosphate oxidase family protein [Fulvivirgaceae bacterium BMA10]